MVPRREPDRTDVSADRQTTQTVYALCIHQRRDPEAHRCTRALRASPSTTTRLTLESHAIRGEECQTSRRDPGEWSAGRVHRPGRFSKLKLVSVAARYDGSLTTAAFDVDSSGRSPRPHRPSRLSLSDPRAILYVYTDPGSERTARATHGFHMNLIRVAPRASGRKCATTAKSWR
jgi:hypothetical protein